MPRNLYGIIRLFPLLYVIVLVAPLRAAEVLDQTTGDAGYLGQGLGGWKCMAQSFVPGENRSTLKRVELWLERDGSPPSDLTLYLRSDSSSGDIVKLTDIKPASVGDVTVGRWFSIDMPANTTVNPGSKYWLVLYASGYSTGVNDIAWFFAKNAYANGSSYISGSSSPAWPPTGNWTTLNEGDLAFRTYSDDSWTDVTTTTTVSESADPITYPADSTTVTITVQDSNHDNVPGGTVTLSVAPKEGTFSGGGSGPVSLSVVSGQASCTWTRPVFTGQDRVYTFAASYSPHQDQATKKTYKASDGNDTLTVNHLHAPSITGLTPTIDDRAGDDIGIFVGGLGGRVVVNNKLTVTASDGEGAADISKVEFFIDGVLKTTDIVAPYDYTHDMSTLGTNNATLKVRVTDKEGLLTEVTRTILTTAAPPWLFAGDTYVLNPQVNWDGGSRKYTFTGKIPNNPALSAQQWISVPYLGNLKNSFESDLDVIETFTTTGQWSYSIKGVLDATVLGQQLLGNEYPAAIRTKTVNPAYSRSLDLASWSKEFELYDETVNVYDGTITSFNVLGIQFNVDLSVDFGFNATVTISAGLGSDLKPDVLHEIRVTPSLSPYIDIDICLDILFGVAKLGAKISPTFTYSMALVYALGHEPNPYWDDPCVEFVLKAKFYVRLLWGLGKWESDELSYGHTDWPAGCSDGKLMVPPIVDLARGLLRDPTPGGSLVPHLLQAPTMAFDAFGNGLALWIHDNDPSDAREDPEIYYARNQGGVWGAPRRLTNNQRWESDPKIAFIGNNQAVAVWTQNTLTEAQGQAAGSLKQVLEAQDIWYSTWNGVAGVWAVPMPLTNDAGAVKPSDGRAALTGNQATGQAIVTWVRDTDGNPSTRNDWDIYWARHQANPPPGAWTPPARLGPANIVLDAEPSVAFAPNGTATCAWVQDADSDPYTNGDRAVMYSKYNAGVWSNPAVLPPPVGIPPPLGVLWPSVTHDIGSNPVIVFTSRTQDPSGRDTGEGFKDRLWFARQIGVQWHVWPSGGTGEGRIAARWPVAQLRPDNFVQVVYRTDTLLGPSGFDGDVGTAVVDVRTTSGDDSPGSVPNNDDVLDWQIDMGVDSTGNVQILWVRQGSDHAGATFGDGYDDLKLMVLPIGMPNLAMGPGDVMLSETYPLPGTNVTVNAKVSNLNTKEVAIPFLVAFYLDAIGPDHLLSTQPVNYLGPNGQATVSMNFPAPLGEHSVLVVADAPRAILETSETDNTGTAILSPNLPPFGVAAFPDPATGGICLTWRPSPVPNAMNYGVYRWDGPDLGYTLLDSVDSATQEFCDFTAAAGLDYRYVVTTFNQAAQESGPSNEVTANVGPDTDGDGIPDIADPDDDADGMPDVWEQQCVLNPLNPADAAQDADGDSFTNLQEYLDGTDPRDPKSHRDVTLPSEPVVVDDGQYTTEPWTLHASWSANDPESEIAEYQYALGTEPGAADLVDWTSGGTATEAVIDGLSLVDGQTYYFSVKARNGAGLWSAVGCGDGIMADTSPPTLPVISDGTGADIDCQAGTSILSAHWSASDAHTGIAHYWYAVGMEPRGHDVQSWTDAGTQTGVTLSGLSLVGGAKYYVTVWAVNGAGLGGVMGVSDGVRVVTQPAAADFDHDCDVDQFDFNRFETCVSGPGIRRAETPLCAAADLDQDDDVDQRDFGIFQRCWGGENMPSDPSCVN